MRLAGGEASRWCPRAAGPAVSSTMTDGERDHAGSRRIDAVLGPRAAAARGRQHRGAEARASLPGPSASGIFPSSTPCQRERCVRATCGPCGDGAGPHPRVPARRAELEHAGGARAGPAGHRAARRGAGRLVARELSHPRARIRVLPGAGGRGAGRAAPAGQGRRAARGSVLARPGPEQAGDSRAGATGPSCRPTSTTTATTSASSPTTSATSSGSARATRCATCCTRSRRPGWRRTTTPSATRSLSAPAAGETVVREVQVRPRSFARPLVVGTLYLDVATAQLVRFRFSFTPAAYLDRQLEDISIVLENSLLRAALLAARTARRSRSGGAPAGSTFRRAASSAAAGRSRATT